MIIAPPIITPRDTTVICTIPVAAIRDTIQTMMPIIQRPAPTMIFILDPVLLMAELTKDHRRYEQPGDVFLVGYSRKLFLSLARSKPALAISQRCADGRTSSSIMIYPSSRRDRANLLRDGSPLRPSRYGAPHSERSHRNANSRNGRANGGDANPIRSLGTPTQTAAPHQQAPG